MYVKCLGSGDAFGSGGKLNTSFFIRAADMGILLDCGASTSIALKRAGLTVNDVDVIIISHFHGDHFGGIPIFIREAQVTRDGHHPLTIIGPEGIELKANKALQCFYPGPGMSDTFSTNFLPYNTGQPLMFGSLKIIAFKAIHSEDTNPHCLRIEAGGKVLAFSGDTEWTDELLKASKGADLFICEASFYEAEKKNHLSVRQLLSKLAQIEAKKIVLTHAGEKVLAHAAEIPIHIAEDGEVLLQD